MDGKNNKNSSSNKNDARSNASALESYQTSVPAAQLDADEFGLPILRYPSCEQHTVARNPSASEGLKTCKSTVSPKVAAAQTEVPTVQDEALASQSTPESEDEGSRAESDSDEAAFEDTQPAILSDSAALSPARSGSGPRAMIAGQSEHGTATTFATLSTVLGPNSGVTSTEASYTMPKTSTCAGVESVARTSCAEESPHLPSSPKTIADDSKAGHKQEPSISTNAKSGLGLSEFSHQQLSTQREENAEDEDQGWQTMPSFARYDMYDDENRLIAREYHEEDEKYGSAGLGGAGKGYTWVITDEDAESATSMDENTQYLFQEGNGTSMAGEEEARDALSQMQATKDLLTEGQRIAYVGVTRLEIAKLVKEAEGVEMTKKTKKEVQTAAEAVKMWGQKMMIRLYSHMDISVAEQVMIEQLLEHGVMPGDLTPVLHANSRLQNPMGQTSVTADGASQGDSSPMSLSPPASAMEERATESTPPYKARKSSGVPEAQTPSQLPKTDKIDIDLRWTVLCDLFLILIADSIYDARSRVLLEGVGASLNISWIDICKFEKRITDALEMRQAAEKENWNEDEHMESRRKMAQTRRYIMMGFATVGGGLVIGLSAGLLAPVIGAGLAAGFTTIGVTGTSSFLAGAGGAAIITSGAAASGSIIGGRAANRRTGAVKTFEYRPLHNKKRVNLIVTVSGWLTGKVDDVRLPFSTVDPIMGDIYSVLWEPEMLRSMGDTINILATEALTQGLQQILGSTILVSLMAALQLPIVLTKLSYLIDNPWAVSLDRATAAGLILADSLLERSLGTRPITLVGYSLGARVIFSCLQELAKKGAYGLIQNVYLFGSPIVVKKEEYVRARTVVCGRFVNGYNRNDWILGYLFRLTNGGIRRVAGLAAIEDCPWIGNMDVTDLVAGHMEYRKAMPTLLMKCGWTVENKEFTEIEDPDPENHQERQRELINEIEEARKELEKESKARKGVRFGIFGRRKKPERQEWEVYEDSMGKETSKEAAKEVNGSGVLFDVDAIRTELATETYYGSADEELKVKEIKSTLPPMKLDIGQILSSVTPSVADGRSALRETRSVEALASGRLSENDATCTTRPSEDNIFMSFDQSLDEANHQQHIRLPKDEGSSRPTMRSSQTVPNVSITDPWADSDDDDLGKEKEISMTFA